MSHSKCKQAFLAIILSGLAALATTAQAGWYYEATTTSTGEGMGGNSEMEVTVWVDGDKTRIEFREVGGGSGFMDEDTYLISTDAGETLFLVDPEEKTYMEFNLGEMMGMAGQVMKGMGGMFKMEFGDFHSEKLGEQDGGNLLGYDTRNLQFKSGYTMSMTVMGRKSTQTTVMDQDIWVTDAIDGRAFNAWLRPDKRFGGMFEGLDEMMEQQFSQVTGVPLRAVIKTVTTDQDGKSSTGTSNTEVTTLREEDVAASVFEIPADYTRQEMMPQADANQEDGQENPMDALKNIFGRKDG